MDANFKGKQFWLGQQWRKPTTWSPVTSMTGLPIWVTSDTKTPPQVYHQRYTDENMVLHNKWNTVLHKHSTHTAWCHHTKVSVRGEDLKNSIKEIGNKTLFFTARSSSWIPASMLTAKLALESNSLTRLSLNLMLADASFQWFRGIFWPAPMKKPVTWTYFSLCCIPSAIHIFSSQHERPTVQTPAL